MSRLVRSLRAELRWVAALALAPWIAVALATGGPVVAVHLLVSLAVLGGLGVIALRLGMAERRGEALVLLAIPVGFVFAAALLALSARLSLSLRVTGWGLAVIGLAGLLLVQREWRGLARESLRYGIAYVVLSAVICGVYFAPGALQDGVTTSEGAFQWMYVDTQNHMAVASAVKTDHGQPKMPGLATAPLTYHFAPFAAAGALSTMTGLPIPDALARVVRGIGLLALLLAALGCGRVLGRRLGGAALGGIASVVGLFFYGSLSALFVPQANSSSAAGLPALLFSVPGLAVVHDAGWFSHLVLGHSELWGGSAFSLRSRSSPIV